MRRRPIIAAFLALALGGCTATLATVRIVKANKAIVAAEDEGAEALAPYELTLAHAYRDKAVEQFADARHGAAMDLADLAATTARLARERATGRPSTPSAEETEALEAAPRRMPDAPEGNDPDEETGDTDPLVEALKAPEEEPAPWEDDDDGPSPWSDDAGATP